MPEEVSSSASIARVKAGRISTVLDGGEVDVLISRLLL